MSAHAAVRWYRTAEASTRSPPPIEIRRRFDAPRPPAHKAPTRPATSPNRAAATKDSRTRLCSVELARLRRPLATRCRARLTT